MEGDEPLRIKAQRIDQSDFGDEAIMFGVPRPCPSRTRQEYGDLGFAAYRHSSGLGCDCVSTSRSLVLQGREFRKAGK